MVPQPLPSNASHPLIPEYFAGREVFVTGATGFMGKVLVERLLRTCPDIFRLHLLIRQKKGVPPEKRLADLKQSQVFDVIRERCPQQLDKLSIVAGDISEPQLGMDADIVNQLSYVTIVFHVAATVRFDEPLRNAVQQNLRSVLTLMDICDQLPNMQVFIYVSTAYSNAELSTVEERVYEAPAKLAQLLALVDALPDHMLKQITPGLIAPKPNTYTFTKAMAESAVHEHARTAKYSLSIFRPTIVTASLRNPFPGWMENLNGPSGVVVATGKGMLHVLSCDLERRADMIPVDLAIDTLIAVAWETGVDGLREARVYHCSSYDNGMTWHQFKDQMLYGLRNHPFDTPLWYPSMFCTCNRLAHTVFETTLQTIPLNFVDYLCRLCGVKTRLSLSVVSKRLHAMNEALKFFTTREWHFTTENSKQLKSRLSLADAFIYNFDVKTINWEAYVVDLVKGARKYLLREEDQNIEKARRHIHMLQMLHKATILLLAFLSARVAVRSTRAILRTISRLLEMRKHF